MEILNGPDVEEVIGLVKTPGHDDRLIDYQALARIPDHRQRYVATKLAIQKSEYVSISDALVNRNNGGNFVLEYLENESQTGRLGSDGVTRPNDVRTWKIQIIQDEFGRAPKPGDLHKWKAGFAKHDEFGVKLNSRLIKEMKRRGTAGKLEEWHGDKIDKYGCIELPYKDACQLLDDYGIHYISDEPITMRKEFTSWEKKDPSDGSMKHVRQWRYREIPPGYEKQLKSLTKRKQNGPETNKGKTGGETPGGQESGQDGRGCGVEQPN